MMAEEEHIRVRNIFEGCALYNAIQKYPNYGEQNQRIRFVKYGFFAASLEDDIMWVKDKLQNSPSNGIVRRLYIKNVFSFVEGVSDGFRELMLLNHMDNPHLSDEEYFVFKETQYELRNGKIEAVHKPMKTIEKIKFVLKKHNESWTRYPIDFSNIGWKSIIETYKVRNRITHPKLDQELWITDNEILNAEMAYSWFFSMTIDLIKNYIGTDSNGESIT